MAAATKRVPWAGVRRPFCESAPSRRDVSSGVKMFRLARRSRARSEAAASLMSSGRRTETNSLKGFLARDSLVFGRKQVACMGSPAAVRS
ncbi:hypothetical protein VCV18_012163 [Metarhizium anisopliae]